MEILELLYYINIGINNVVITSRSEQITEGRLRQVVDKGWKGFIAGDCIFSAPDVEKVIFTPDNVIEIQLCDWFAEDLDKQRKENQ
jgi:hypothetical protein